MQARQHEFTRPTSPQLSFLTTPNHLGNVHVQTHFDNNVPANKIIHVTNYNRGSVSDSILEDSCDSFMDTDTEDASLPGNPQADAEPYLSLRSALNKVVNTKPDISDPYHRYAQHSSGDLSPRKELQKLIKEVETSKPTTPEYSPRKDEFVIDKLMTDGIPQIKIIEEPETTYRARYESEGCKGPIHGATETGFPTIKIEGYVGDVVITVFVVTREDEPHLHTATGPGSTKAPCKEVTLKDGTPAIQMLMKPEDENDEMVAIFDQLSIRRVRNWEADRELRKRGIEPSTWKSKKKEAKLAFQASIAPSKNHTGYLLTTYSRPFLCTAPSGNPEIWWASLSECSAEGGEEMGFIGKKFASGFKVRFFSKEDYGNTWEAFAEVDKAKSNLNACVVKVPPYKETTLTESIVVYVEIRVGPEKEPRNSDPYPFTYSASKTVEGCANCAQIKGFLQRVYSAQSGDMPSSLTVASLNAEAKQDSPERNIDVSKKGANIEPTTPTKLRLDSPVKRVANMPSVLPSSVSNDIRVLLQQDKSVLNGTGANNIAPSTLGVLYVQNNVLPVAAPTSRPNVAAQSGFMIQQPVYNNKPIQNITAPALVNPQTINATNLTTANFVGSQQQINAVNSLLSVLPKTIVSVTTQTALTQTPIVHLPNNDMQAASHVTYRHTTQAVPILVSSEQRAGITGLITPTLTVPSNYELVNQCATAPVVNMQSGGTKEFLQNSPIAIQQAFEKVKEEEISPNYLQDKQHLYNSQVPMFSNNALTFPLISTRDSQNVNVSTPSSVPIVPRSIPCVNVLNSTSTAMKPFDSAADNFLPTQTVPLEKQIQILTNHVEKLKKLKTNETMLQYNVLGRQQGNFLQSQTQLSFPTATTVEPFVHSKLQQAASQLHVNQQPIQVQSSVYQQMEKEQVQHASPDYQIIQSALANENLASAISTSFITATNPVQTVPTTYTAIAQKQAYMTVPQSLNQVLPTSTYQTAVIYQQQNGVGQQQQFTSSNFSNTASQQQASITPFSNSQNSHQAQQTATVYNQQVAHVHPSSYQTQSQPQTSSFTLQQQAFQQPSQPHHQHPSPTFQQHPSPTFQQQQQLFENITNLTDFSKAEFENDATKESQWQTRPSINDAIATNKVGYHDNNTNTQRSSRAASPMKLNENENNNFLTALEQLNNSQTFASSLPSTPVAMTNHVSVFNTTSSDIQLSQMDNSVVEANELNQSEVSVDYSDAYKNVNKSTSNTWVSYQSDTSQYGQSTLYQQHLQPTPDGIQKGW